MTFLGTKVCSTSISNSNEANFPFPFPFPFPVPVSRFPLRVPVSCSRSRFPFPFPFPFPSCFPFPAFPVGPRQFHSCLGFTDTWPRTQASPGFYRLQYEKRERLGDFEMYVTSRGRKMDRRWVCPRSRIDYHC